MDVDCQRRRTWRWSQELRRPEPRGAESTHAIGFPPENPRDADATYGYLFGHILTMALRQEQAKQRRASSGWSTARTSRQAGHIVESKSVTDLATTYCARVSRTSSAWKCALPQAIFARSLSRRSSAKSPLFVSTTK